jgi:uncharacterized membrane protein YtjA (UPF0391 family)
MMRVGTLKACLTFGSTVPETFEMSRKEATMLYWAVVFFIIAIVAVPFGFAGIAPASAGTAQILFGVFAALFVITLIAQAIRK